MFAMCAQKIGFLYHRIINMYIKFNLFQWFHSQLFSCNRSQSTLFFSIRPLIKCLHCHRLSAVWREPTTWRLWTGRHSITSALFTSGANSTHPASSSSLPASSCATNTPSHSCSSAVRTKLYILYWMILFNIETKFLNEVSIDVQGPLGK